MTHSVWLRFQDVWAAIWTWPNAKTWRRCFVVYAVFFAAVVPFGFAKGFLRIGLAALSFRTAALLPIYILLRPAILEEILFRALLLPRSIRRMNKLALAANCIAALALFVISHPLHAWLTRPAALGLFTNPVFLTCAALLGTACTLTYLISRSIWPPVVLHWISVLVWILFLGGQALTGRVSR